MRIVIISDTHNQHHLLGGDGKDGLIPVPDGDVLIHLGDVCDKGKVEHLRSFAPWFNALPHKHKLIIQGNHDRNFKDPSQLDLKKELCSIDRCQLLLDQTADIDGVRFYGTSWEASEADDFTAWPKEHEHEVPPVPIDILLTHLGPHGVRGNGSWLLLNEIVRRAIPLHLFGHNHTSRGCETHGTTTFVNCSSTVTGSGSLAPPAVIDYDPALRQAVGVDVPMTVNLGDRGWGR